MVVRVFFLLIFLAFVPAPAVAKNDASSVAPTARQDEARIPYKSSAETDGASLATRVVGGFIVVALLAFGSIYVLKRFFPSFYLHSSSDAKHIRVLEIRRLTPRTTLFLIELDGARLLLAQSGDQVVNLHRTSTTLAEPGDTSGPSL